MLPDVQGQERCYASRQLQIVLLDLQDKQLIAHRLVGEDRPSAPLHRARCLGELVFKRLDRSERLGDRIPDGVLGSPPVCGPIADQNIVCRKCPPALNVRSSSKPHRAETFISPLAARISPRLFQSFI